MGQKVNPHGLRVGIIKDWDAKWYAEKDFADNLIEDVKIRKFIKNKLYAAGVSKITIERTAGRVKVNVRTRTDSIRSLMAGPSQGSTSFSLDRSDASRMKGTGQ